MAGLEIKTPKKLLSKSIKNIFIVGSLNNQYFKCNQCKQPKYFGLRTNDDSICIHCIKVLLKHHQSELKFAECGLCKKSESACLNYHSRRLCRPCQDQYSRRRDQYAEEGCHCYYYYGDDLHKMICYSCAIASSKDYKLQIGADFC